MVKENSALINPQLLESHGMILQLTDLKTGLFVDLRSPSIQVIGIIRKAGEKKELIRVDLEKVQPLFGGVRFRMPEKWLEGEQIEIKIHDNGKETRSFISTISVEYA